MLEIPREIFVDLLKSTKNIFFLFLVAKSVSSEFQKFLFFKRRFLLRE